MLLLGAPVRTGRAVVTGGWRHGPLGPDDHRPETTWRLAVDPGNPDGSFAQLAVLEERCAVGDRIPLHRHDVDELVIIRDGRAEYDLAGEQHVAGAGDTVFIPARHRPWHPKRW